MVTLVLFLVAAIPPIPTYKEYYVATDRGWLLVKPRDFPDSSFKYTYKVTDDVWVGYIVDPEMGQAMAVEVTKKGQEI